VITALLILGLIYLIISLITGLRRTRSYRASSAEQVKVQTSLTTRIIFSIIFIPLIFGYGKAFIELLVNLKFNEALLYFCIGFAVHASLWHILKFNSRQKGNIYSTFEHEFTHVVVGLLSFHQPSGFMASSNNGGVTTYKKRVNFMVKLAPYFLLTFCLFLIPVYFLLKPSYYIFYFALLGVLTSYHTFSTIKETGFWQTDITTTGKFFSVVVIILGNLINYGLILAFVVGRMPLLKWFLSDGVRNIWQAVQIF
ncbi:MAG: hypothetical protein KGY74_11010, partial [Candidatus Cloacimonetes bacterium]|nr:hypothetical protein [Candidatus Cloacimonadota bacterium]